MTKPVIAYIRVSTDDQKLSPEVQRDQISRFAASNGYHVDRWFSDIGISGATPIPDRPSLSQAINHALSHKPHALIVSKRDRLARDVLISIQVERSLPKQTQILSADNTGNGQSPSDALMRTILDGMSEYERSLIRQRTTLALKQKRANGYRAGTVPFGFQADPQGKLSPHPEEQAIIVLVHNLSQSLPSQRAITRELLTRGVVSPRSYKPLLHTQVVRILQNAMKEVTTMS